MTARQVSVAKRASSYFHRCTRDPEQSPPSAQISNSLAPGIDQRPFSLPPAPNTLHCKRRRVVVLTYDNPVAVSSGIVESVGNSLAQLLVREIMHVGLFRLTFGLPLPACIFEFTHVFLFLGVYGQYWQTTVKEALYLVVDVLKLGVSVWML